MKREIDFEALYVSLDSKRVSEGMSWSALAREIGVTPSTFTNLSRGRGVDSATFVTLTGWLQVPADRFVTGGAPLPDSNGETMAIIAGHLRADKNLKPESARAIQTVLEAAYDRLRDEASASS